MLRQHALRQLLETQFTFLIDSLLFFNDYILYSLLYRIFCVDQRILSSLGAVTTVCKNCHPWNKLISLAHVVLFISEALLNYDDDDGYTLDDT